MIFSEVTTIQNFYHLLKHLYRISDVFVADAFPKQVMGGTAIRIAEGRPLEVDNFKSEWSLTSTKCLMKMNYPFLGT